MFSVYVCVIYMYDAFILCHTTSPVFMNDEPIHMVIAQGSRHQQVVFFPTMWTADVFGFQNTKDLIFLNSQETGRRYKWPCMSEINVSDMLLDKRMTNAYDLFRDRTGGGCKMTNFVREVKTGGGRPAPATVTVRPPPGAVRVRVKRGCWDTQTRLGWVCPKLIAPRRSSRPAVCQRKH